MFQDFGDKRKCYDMVLDRRKQWLIWIRISLLDSKSGTVSTNKSGNKCISFGNINCDLPLLWIMPKLTNIDKQCFWKHVIWWYDFIFTFAGFILENLIKTFHNISLYPFNEFLMQIKTKHSQNVEPFCVCFTYF